MELEFLTEYAVPVIVGICLCVGFVIKQSLPGVPNRYIPLVMAVLGLILNVWDEAVFIDAGDCAGRDCSAVWQALG